MPAFCWALSWHFILRVLVFLHLPPNLVVMGEWLYLGDFGSKAVCLLRAPAVLSESEDTEVQIAQKILHLWSADYNDSLASACPGP